MGHQIGQWIDDQAAAEFIAEVVLEKGPGLHHVDLPASIAARSILADGTELLVDKTFVRVRGNGSVVTAWPYNSQFLIH